MRRCIVILPIFAFFGWALLQAQTDRPPQPLTCHEISLARPGNGVSYSGTIQNSDYGFSIRVPDGLTGWGAAPNAPFHGFTIYLRSDESSCIVFQIQIRVVLPEDVSAPASSVPATLKPERVNVGNRVGLQTVNTGTRNGVEIENRTVSLELLHRDHYDDATFILVTPKSDEAKTRAVFERFLASWMFR